MNGMMRKSLFAIIAVMILAGAVAGCGKPQAQSVPATEENQSVSENKANYGLRRSYEVPDGWIAAINDGVGEIMNRTYVYWDEAGYKYINVTSNTQSWGSATWIKHYCSEGVCSSKEEVLEAAKEFGSAGFVTIPDDYYTKTLTLDDFLETDF